MSRCRLSVSGFKVLRTKSRSSSSIARAISFIPFPCPEPSSFSSPAFLSASFRRAACCAAMRAHCSLKPRPFDPSRPMDSFIFESCSPRACCMRLRSPALTLDPFPPGFSQFPEPGCAFAMACCIWRKASSSIKARLLKLVMTYCWSMVMVAVWRSPNWPNALSMWWFTSPISR